MPVLILPIYAQTPDTIVFSQISVRDSQDNLITIFEAKQIGYINEVALNNFLDYVSTSDDPIVDVNGQKIQIISRNMTLNFDSNNVISDTTLNVSRDDGQVVTLVRLFHDGIPVTMGDMLTTVWTFIRPL